MIAVYPQPAAPTSLLKPRAVILSGPPPALPDTLFLAMSAEVPCHIPVLLRETIARLAPRSGEVAVDGTLGGGGHTAALLDAVGEAGRVLAFDLDAGAIEAVRSRFAEALTPSTTDQPRLELIHGSFTAMPRELKRRGLRANVILCDLGFSSLQMDDPGRGFSFAADGPLDMRLDPAAPVTAAELVASLPEGELADLIYQYGEEPFSRRIARKLVEERRIQPIQSTARLAELVVAAYGSRARHSRMHPATRTFMALRIAVNDELGALRSLLDALDTAAAQIDDPSTWLTPETRVAVISFHSLEDRLVKHAFADLDRRGLATRLTKKPVTASETELDANPRARSAKLRVARIGGPRRT